MTTEEGAVKYNKYQIIYMLSNIKQIFIIEEVRYYANYITTQTELISQVVKYEQIFNLCLYPKSINMLRPFGLFLKYYFT